MANEAAIVSPTDPIQSVLDYWFGELNDGKSDQQHERRWFEKSESTDADIREQFGDLAEAAQEGQLASWTKTAEGRLAVIILLDQFSRNLYRGSIRAFECDKQALNIVKEGLVLGHDKSLPMEQKAFFYIPFEHAENLSDQEQGVSLLEAMLAEVTDEHKANVENYLAYSCEHRDIIQQFGRFPHRNEVLGRETTAAEQAFLQQHQGF